ncbi:GspH/FimT family pseudopilin [Aeromonas allosaccharophila]|uniref:GspH/FimT family pseudopilin n=1 Tax=Aeromonas allosaccharophila TaxID=656 RepID=UPI0039885A09
MDSTEGRSAGFTLIELMVALALVALLLTVALPSYQSLRQEQMVKAATMAVYTDVMLLKSEAIKRNSSLSLIVFNSGASNWCYRIAIDGVGSCNGCSDTCSSLDGRKGADASEFAGVNLTTSYSGGKLTFSPRRGTLPSGNITLASNGTSMKVMTSNLGRVRTCAISNLGGEVTCSD